MINKISNFFIQDLLSKIDILKYISRYLKINKKGNYFYINCPFHYDKTPSLNISYEKQLYYCFGCGAHGNLISFVMNYNKISFIEAIKELAEYCNIQFKYEKKYLSLKDYKRNEIFNIMYKISKFYQNFLDTSESEAYNYIYLIRGIDKSTILEFNIGFSPNNSNIIKHLNCSISLLKKTGIFIEKNNGRLYSIFQNRIIFPIRDLYGNIIAFGGRSINNLDKPKYLNSYSTIIFNKSKILYGLYEIKRNYNIIKKILLVEGYIDVITLFQFGIKYSVSTLGTSITSYHIKSIYSITDNLICCYDGDQSGYAASWKVLKCSIPYLIDGRKISFVFFPNNEDPDSFIRKVGKNNFKEYINNNSKSFFDFLFEKLISKINFNQYEGKAKLGSIAISLINLIPGKIFKFYLKRKLYKKLNLPYRRKLYNYRELLSDSLKIKYNIVFTSIGILIQNPHLHMMISDIYPLNSIKDQEMSLFVKIVEVCKNNYKINTAQLLEYFRNNKYYIILGKLAIWNHMIRYDKIEKTFSDALSKLYNYAIELKQEALILREKKYGLTKKERIEFLKLSKEKKLI